MPSLLPPNATSLETATEAAMHQPMDAINVPVRDLWNPAKCPLPLLPWLAWALSVDEWDESWSEATKRSVVASSVAVHRIKGTATSVKKALASIGVKIEHTEWFDDNSEPHTFKITALANGAQTTGNTIIGPELYQTIRRAVDATKPARSHYDLRVGAKFETGIKAAAHMTGSSFTRTTAQTKTHSLVRQTGFAIASAAHAVSVLRLTMEAA